MEENSQLDFSLDIGTRSVIGLVTQQNDKGLKIIASERLEHITRAMLDGQIHDIPQVAKVIGQVKEKLEKTVGPLKKAAVAAAGRALCTLNAEVEQDISGRGWLRAEDVRLFELNAVQEAQYQLAQKQASEDATMYYCVGYSVIQYKLDASPIHNLQGQRGQTASVEVIATFLPRVVIDSLHSALNCINLEIQTLTLEPIAAINALIPPTMRHLNLAVVDVGAGTSDVAITANGSVVAYGMVPCAGDEITEAISNHYLLDFNVAEQIKRELTKKQVSFTDVLGMTYKRDSTEVLAVIENAVHNLAAQIAGQITLLNQTAPQGVLLVGGGSLTPGLTAALAKALEMPPEKVAIRTGKSIAGFVSLPKVLQGPDAITPLGIAKLANQRTLSFITIIVNGKRLSMFDFGKIKLSDALLIAGIDTRSLHGKPGMALSVMFNGQTQFIRGELGTPAILTVNGQPAKLDDEIHDGDVVAAQKGCDGATANAMIDSIVPEAAPFHVKVNGQRHALQPLILVNGEAGNRHTSVKDRDVIEVISPTTVERVLMTLEFSEKTYKPTTIQYTLNNKAEEYLLWPEMYLNSDPCRYDTPVKSGDILALDVDPPELPYITCLPFYANVKEAKNMMITVNNQPYYFPLEETTVTLDGKTAGADTVLRDGCSIVVTQTVKRPPIINDLLLYLDVDLQTCPENSKLTLLLNGHPSELTTELKDGDKVEISI